MSRGKINLQANDGAVIGLVVPDGLTSGERQIALGANLSGITAYHLLQGNLAVSNSTITKGFDTKLYTSGSAITGIDMDTQWGSTVEEKFGGLVWLKDRVEATNNFLYDTIRGATKEINTNTTEAEATLAGGLTAFNSTGFTVGADTGHNSTSNNMVSWNFQTTHRVSGTTNHGKAVVNHYNPTTGFGIAVYTGSGIAGHDIQTMLGRKVAFATIKNLSTVLDWLAQYRENNYMYLNLTNAETSSNTVITNLNDNSMTLGISATCNTLNQQYVVYYWANSYFDESNKLIGNYELVTYQGTGAAGNKIKTKGKPAWVMVKRLDSVGDWYIFDNQRDTDLLKDHFLVPNQAIAEAVAATFGVNFLSDGFSCNDGQAGNNATGGQYIALVAYDTNADGGGSYYPLTSDTANLQINNALIPLAQGIDGNGVKNTILSKNETITGLTYTQGKNYVYCDKNGSYGRMSIAPNYGKVNPANGGDFYNVITNKWFTSAGVEITNSRNYLNHIVYADNDGDVLYVEELPKVEYKDIVKANEFKGKNALTAWVNLDGTTTPPTIRDSYNVSAVIRTSTGVFDIYFEEPMDNTNYVESASGSPSEDNRGSNFDVYNSSKTQQKFTVRCMNQTDSLFVNYKSVNIQIFGGKN